MIRRFTFDAIASGAGPCAGPWPRFNPLGLDVVQIVRRMPVVLAARAVRRLSPSGRPECPHGACGLECTIALDGRGWHCATCRTSGADALEYLTASIARGRVRTYEQLLVDARSGRAAREALRDLRAIAAAIGSASAK